MTGNASNDTGLPSPDTNISKQPTLASLPEGIPAEKFKVKESSVPLPSVINGSLVPVGKVYDIELDIDGKPMIPNSRITFEKPVQIVYEYDEEKLKKSGFTDEFYVYFFESRTGKWEPVQKVKKDSTKKVVIAETDHFTPFILVAAPVIPNTTTPLPPACIASDFFPQGLAGAAVRPLCLSIFIPCTTRTETILLMGMILEQLLHFRTLVFEIRLVFPLAMEGLESVLSAESNAGTRILSLLINSIQEQIISISLLTRIWMSILLIMRLPKMLPGYPL